MEYLIDRVLPLAAKLWLKLLSPSMMRLWALGLGLALFLAGWYGWRLAGRTALGRAMRWWTVASVVVLLAAGVLYQVVAAPADPEVAAASRQLRAERLGGMPYPAGLAAFGVLVMALAALAAGWRWHMASITSEERLALAMAGERLRHRGRPWAAIGAGIALLAVAGAGVAGVVGAPQVPALTVPSPSSPPALEAARPVGALWVGTPAGVSRLETGPRGPIWRVATRPRAPLPASHVTAIAPGPGGTVWIATHGGLARYTSGQAVSSWRTATVENAGLPYPTVLGLAVDDGGVAWAATGAGAAMVDPRGDGRAFTQRNAPLLHQLLDAAHVDSAGRVWFGGAGGVNVYQPARPGVTADWLVGFSRHSTSGALPSSQVYAIVGDSKGRVWFGTSGGAAALIPAPQEFALGTVDPARWLTLTRPGAPLADDAVHAIVEDPQGRIWFGTERGITLLDEGAPTLEQRWQQFGTGPGALPHPWVQALAVGPDGRIWAGTRNGLAVYDPAHPKAGWLTYHAHPVRRWTGYFFPPHWEANLLVDEVTALAWVP